MNPTPETGSRGKITTSVLGCLIISHVANKFLSYIWISYILREKETLRQDEHILKYCDCQRQSWMGVDTVEKLSSKETCCLRKSK